MTDFDFRAKTKVSYGVNRVDRVAEDVASLGGGGRVVLVTDPGLVQLGVADRVAGALSKGGVDAVVFSAIQSDPSGESIDRAADVVRETGARCVVGLGGGSAMDVAKLASLVAGADRPAEHYALMAHPFPAKRIASVMIPTTSGTGAEVTSTVVFSNREKRKVWGWDPELAPDVALLDPTLTAALPPHLTAATGLDALIHAMEAVSGKRGHAMIDAVGLQAIRLIAANLLRAVERPADLEARGRLSVGSMLAGLAIEQGGTGIAHCIGHALGTLARVHHGRAVAIALYRAIEWNVPGNVAAYADIARAMGAKGAFGASEEAAAYAVVDAYRELAVASGLRLSLSEDGLTEADAPRFAALMASEENAPMRNNNARYADEDDLLRFAKLMLA